MPIDGWPMAAALWPASSILFLNNCTGILAFFTFLAVWLWCWLDHEAMRVLHTTSNAFPWEHPEHMACMQQNAYIGFATMHVHE